MKEMRCTNICKKVLWGLAFCAGMAGVFFSYIPQEFIRGFLLLSCSAVVIATTIWALWQGRLLSDFSNDICDTVDALMEGREPKNFFPYEETASSKVQEKLLQYYEKLKDEQQQSLQDKQTIQELVSDISHQVKTPTANIQMIADILIRHELPREKQNNFLDLMSVQISKLDFLMQSLIKMSRLETGTFVLHPEKARLSDTIAGAMSMILAKAEKKNIRLSADCDSKLTVNHDPKWTAEAIGNILDNAVKYTPEDGAVSILVRPWQFYTRIDISDTGIGIDEENYNSIFQRFYRAEEVAPKEGVGLGLYLARGIITRQNGFITVKSKRNEGSTFSVFLLS
ncbi:alkaline phosphatase synthesis sensor protein PhoR [Lachnospiraceae bacterium]|nr:alkaline phosphatase synthesis sensor protein PhoR [Lachnospiraceae bacterium]